MLTAAIRFFRLTVYLVGRDAPFYIYRSEKVVSMLIEISKLPVADCNVDTAYAC